MIGPNRWLKWLGFPFLAFFFLFFFDCLAMVHFEVLRAFSFSLSLTLATLCSPLSLMSSRIS